MTVYRVDTSSRSVQRYIGKGTEGSVSLRREEPYEV